MLIIIFSFYTLCVCIHASGSTAHSIATHWRQGKQGQTRYTIICRTHPSHSTFHTLHGAVCYHSWWQLIPTECVCIIWLQQAVSQGRWRWGGVHYCHQGQGDLLLVTWRAWLEGPAIFCLPDITGNGMYLYMNGIYSVIIKVTICTARFCKPWLAYWSLTIYKTQHL